jgi:hypothetical protein
LILALLQAKQELERHWTRVNGSVQQGTQAGTTDKAKSPMLLETGLSIPETSPIDVVAIGGVEEVKKAKFQWLWLSLAQLAIVSVIMCIAAYGVYASSFVGRNEEMIGIFIFALGLDFTLDSIKLIKPKSGG